MQEIKPIKGQTLDEIYYQKFQTLEGFESFLELNAHLCHKSFLSIDDRVKIPDTKQQPRLKSIVGVF